jgi:hypothetical protein
MQEEEEKSFDTEDPRRMVKNPSMPMNGNEVFFTADEGSARL